MTYHEDTPANSKGKTTDPTAHRGLESKRLGGKRGAKKGLLLLSRRRRVQSAARVVRRSVGNGCMGVVKVGPIRR